MRAHLLSNGRLTSVLTPNGGGGVWFDGRAITRWVPDPVLDQDGSVVYLRDLDDGRFWSIGLRPAGTRATRYKSCLERGRANIESRNHDIESLMDVVVDSSRDVELRRIRLTNCGERRRVIELTAYAELVLDTPAGQAAHPAFSKLFVQTGHLSDREALIAWRRLRSPAETPLFAVHRLFVSGSMAAIAFETDRARFIGRGNDVSAPRALTSRVPLDGITGNVLDPVFATRAVVTLEPGDTAECTTLLGASGTRAGAESLLDHFAVRGAIAATFASALPAPLDAIETTGLPPEWAATLKLEVQDWRAAPRLVIERATTAAPTTTTHVVVVEENTQPIEELRLFNGFGGFSADGTEYVIRIPSGVAGQSLPPLPWINVIANERIGCLVSERGAGYTWAMNSRENRLTPWSNDPIADTHGEALYLRDDEDGSFWSLTPGPVPGAGDYEVRHGFGYTRFLHSSRGLEQSVCVFVPPDDSVTIVYVRVRNRSDRARRLSLVRYAQLVLGVNPADTRGKVSTRRNTQHDAILASNSDRVEFSGRVAFAALRSERAGDRSYTTNRAAFLGQLGSLQRPAALLADTPLDGAAGAVADACIAQRCQVELEPDGTLECAFLLGEEVDEAAALACIDRYHDIPQVAAALQSAIARWQHLLGAVQIETPVPALDLMVNGWSSYQNLACRMWARSALYQSGGAFGYRDQLQDAAALLYLDPAITRAQILLHAGHQFIEGDVLHWWHPPLGKGIRTRFSDDLLWLPHVTWFYVRRTGDLSVLDESVRFLSAEPLEHDEDEKYIEPIDSGHRGTVYEHCCRALDRSLTAGEHLLPLMGAGDWNDGMNRVGRAGRGESVWLGFFLFDVLTDFIPLCRARQDTARARCYGAYLAQLGAALNDGGWDGAWYRRAYYDDGSPLGSFKSDECRIDTIAQAWAVISRAAPADRAERALDAMECELVSEEDRIIRLLTPAFDRTPHDPGYIKGYLPGVRENGGQYTHGALWAVRALAETGRRERAALLLEMLSPISHTRTKEEVAVYQAEPYVIAADVYGEPPHVGRAGWTWYTGSAGWLFRVALESVLGFELQGDRIMLRPCIPHKWPGFRLRYRQPDGTAYAFEVTQAVPLIRTRAMIDHSPLAVRDGAVELRLLHDGAEHAVHIELGSDVGPRYRSRLPSSSEAPLERITSA